MKYLFILIIFLTSLNAEYLLQYGSYEYCIDSYSIRDSDRYIDIVLSSNGQTYTLDININQIHPGYVYDPDNKTCNKRDELIELGLDYYQYNFLFAFLGLLIGFSFLNAVLLIFKK